MAAHPLTTDGDGRAGTDPGPADLVARGTAAHLAGDHVTAVRLLQHAYRAHRDRGAPEDALRTAVLLGLVFGTTGQPALFSGWLARAQRLLAEVDPAGPDGGAPGPAAGPGPAGAESPGRGEGSPGRGEGSVGRGAGSTGPDDVAASQDAGPPSAGPGSPARGYVALLELHRALGAGDFAAVGARAAEVLEAGQRHHDPDLLVLGLTARGRYVLYAGDVPAGLALLDEAMAGLLTGEAGALATGMAWCAAIEGCQEIGAVDRLVEWTAALRTWCADQPGLAAFAGECSLHTGQVLSLHGAWAEAAREFDAARCRFEDRGRTGAAGAAERERGDLLRLWGRLDEAEAAYREAAERGCDPQPGLALLWLARGRPAAATAALRRCLEETVLAAHRVALLPAAVEVFLAEGRTGEAEALLAELDVLAAATGCAPVLAAAAHGHARADLVGGDPGGALPYARKAVRAWSGIGCPYETARSRTVLAQALAGVGDVDSARAELDAARAAFRALGAAPAAAEADGALASLTGPGVRAGGGPAGGPGAGGDPEPRPAGLTGREVEVLRLVAAGRSNRQVATALQLSEKTVARHLSNIFAKTGAGSRTEAAAFAFEHGLV